MSVEQKKVACAFASVTQAKRTFIQVFPASLLPPHYFESVLHNGVLKWAVLLGNEVALVPPNASDGKRCLRLEMSKVYSMQIDEGDKFQFAETDMTLHSAKIKLCYEEPPDKKRSEKGTQSSSPKRGLFGIKRSSKPGILTTSPMPPGLVRKKSDELQDAPPELKDDGFHRFERKSQIHFYADQMWVCELTSILYGWKTDTEQQQEGTRVKELFLDLQQEITCAKDLQEKVDLLDELALAARFNVPIKKLITMQSPSLISWMSNELWKYTVDSWEMQMSAQGTAEKKRQEAIQYVTVLLETIHKTLFGSWPVFADRNEGQSLVLPLLEPKGDIDQLAHALNSIFIKPDEYSERNAAPFFEVINLSMAVMYQVMLIYMQAAAFEESHDAQQNMELKLQALVVSAPYLEKRMLQIMQGFKYAILTQPEGPLQTATLYHYSAVLKYLATPAGPISKALAEHHTEDFHFIVPRFLHKQHKHPLDRRSAVYMYKLLAAFCPDVAVKIPEPSEACTAK